MSSQTMQNLINPIDKQKGCRIFFSIWKSKSSLLNVPSRSNFWRGICPQILISFNEPRKLNTACQNQRWWSQNASSTTVGEPSFPWNCPCHATGKFLHLTCMQSKELAVSLIPHLQRCIVVTWWSLAFVMCWRKSCQSSSLEVTILVSLINASWIIINPIWK